MSGGFSNISQQVAVFETPQGRKRQDAARFSATHFKMNDLPPLVLGPKPNPKSELAEQCTIYRHSSPASKPTPAHDRPRPPFPYNEQNQKKEDARHGTISAGNTDARLRQRLHSGADSQTRLERASRDRASTGYLQLRTRRGTVWLQYRRQHPCVARSRRRLWPMQHQGDAFHGTAAPPVASPAGSTAL